MDAGYKFKGGKFVKRTAEEAQRLAEYFKKDEAPVAKSKMPKSKKLFVRITLEQADKLYNHIKSFKGVMLFIMLSYEHFRNHGEPFQLPTAVLVEARFSLATQRRALAQLEKAGLISVQQRPPKPPIVTVL